MNQLFVVFIGTIACVYAAPTSTQGTLINPEIAELKAAFQPVQQELRALYDNAEFAVKDLATSAAKSLNDLSENAKQIINPADRSMSHNIIEETRSLANSAQDSVKELLTKAINDYEPIKMNEKSAFITSNDALKLLEQKYLTKDGQELIRAVTGVARKVPFVQQ